MCFTESVTARKIDIAWWNVVLVVCSSERKTAVFIIGNTHVKWYVLKITLRHSLKPMIYKHDVKTIKIKKRRLLIFGGGGGGKGPVAR